MKRSMLIFQGATEERTFVEKRLKEDEARSWQAPNLSTETRQRIRESKIRNILRERYPTDMGFHPFSTKFCEGAVLKTPWLAKYWHYRNMHRDEGLSRQACFEYLAQLGADNSDQADRCRGALMGLALGDTLGVPLEFSQRDVKQVHGIEGGGPFNLKPGEWTDDTSMACCLAYSLISCQGFDPSDQMLCLPIGIAMAHIARRARVSTLAVPHGPLLNRLSKRGNLIPAVRTRVPPETDR